MNPAWLFRMSKRARRPPSAARVKLVFGVIIAALVIIAIEQMGWWPDWATAERMPRKF
ncbi:hypothetical protein [Sulfitobacter aestuariivivens]|uniref:Uncharacterized protein n=1 Tax=Sulfitobacter aestuariivivens TaxID=2766981 RepID=A0A927HE98_9RHOB|nr:hypothetical protein [Sulfitobacter aestuariivivens]MBD3663158.1 hypothetical protein [Sulfitobacter aestuariivivens]